MRIVVWNFIKKQKYILLNLSWGKIEWGSMNWLLFILASHLLVFFCLSSLNLLLIFFSFSTPWCFSIAIPLSNTSSCNIVAWTFCTMEKRLNRELRVFFSFWSYFRIWVVLFERLKGSLSTAEKVIAMWPWGHRFELQQAAFRA